MRRFLVVGCGGSGGKTLAYLMDQLRSDLSKDGVEELPAGWQFVFVDVPSGVDPGPDGLGSVVAQGGQYVGMGPRGGSYPDLDSAVSQKLRAKDALDRIGTWAPSRPEAVTTPIDVGAGQYRAIGRMILLARAGEVRRSLQQAWSKLFVRDTDTAMINAAHATGSDFDANLPPIIFVVGSMAGGSGASMALDVCRLLTQIPGVNPKLISVFMVSADIFDSLPPADRAGVRANALAMLGEIVASQAGAARQHDVALLSGLGYSDGDGTPIPFARVFPVSRLMGVQRAIFGDGSMNAVYRGLARGLAGLISSDVATRQFVDFDLGNSGSVAANPKYLGWGADAQPIPWGSYGFASLSMGRDRYAEYAAQRIARSAVDRLLDGHLQPGNQASGTEQVNALLDSQWGTSCARLQIPAGGGGAQQAGSEVGAWMMTTALPSETGNATARQITDREYAPHVPSPQGQQAAQWTQYLAQKSAERRQPVSEAVSRAAYAWAFDWHQGLRERTENVIGDAVAKLGLPYAGALVERLSAHLADAVAPGAQVISRTATTRDIVELPDEVAATLLGTRGTLSGGEAIVAKVVEGVRTKVRSQLYTQASGLVSDGLRTFTRDVLAPLQAALREAQAVLEQSRGAQVALDGLAQLETVQYGAWPSDADSRVPQRFDEANNEVLLTTSRQFAAQYTADLDTSVASGRAGGSARGAVISQVIAGEWSTTGEARPPGGLIQLTTGWRSKVFPTDPVNGESLIPSEARFDVHVRPRELLERARLFVRRPDESFDRFCSVSLRDYLSGPNVRESEREGRHRDVTTKFRETLSLAVPLISVDEQSVQILHGGNSVEYRYKFSAVPFRNLGIARDLEGVLTGNPNTDRSSLDNFSTSLTDQGNPRRIDVFGSYPLYSPLVFDSILEPVAQEWDATPTQGRGAYWTYRRARPLDAALPMSEPERRAMVAGWYVAQLVGELRIPDPPYRAPVQIWDADEARWVAFPDPLLTPPDRFRSPYDWLPAVLESSLLAMARVQQAPVMSSMRPYQLLRGLYDDGEFGPASGIVAISAVAKLKTWLLQGSVSGLASRIPTVAAATTIEERLDAAKAWLTGPGGPGDLAVKHLLPPPDPGAHGGSFSIIGTRAQAAETPLLRDLAPDVAWATNRLAQVLDEAYAAASRETAAPDDEPFSGQLPSGGVF